MTSQGAMNWKTWRQTSFVSVIYEWKCHHTEFELWNHHHLSTSFFIFRPYLSIGHASSDHGADLATQGYDPAGAPRRCHGFHHPQRPGKSASSPLTYPQRKFSGNEKPERHLACRSHLWKEMCLETIHLWWHGNTLKSFRIHFTLTLVGLEIVEISQITQ